MTTIEKLYEDVMQDLCEGHGMYYNDDGECVYEYWGKDGEWEVHLTVKLNNL